MRIAKSAAAWIVAAAIGSCAFGIAPEASAADLSATPLPLKAKAPVADPPLDIHGLVDFSFRNAYLTPRGLLVTNTGLTTQILSLLSVGVYKDKSGFIQDISLYAGVWNDLWSEQRSRTAGSWNEFDWFAGAKVKFANTWTFGIEYIEFLSPPGNFSDEQNLEFSLAYDDSSWGWPVTLNPYVKLFYEVRGPSTVVTGKNGGVYDVELGFAPTISLAKTLNLPITLSAPTWVTVGPSNYWNRGVTGCGATALAACPRDNVGVFSTGLTAQAPLTFIPKRLGNWYVKAGFQYFNFLNDSLRLAQVGTGTATSFNTSNKDYVVGFGGIGFTF